MKRTHDMYLNQVEVALSSQPRKAFKGIIDRSFLSEFMQLPRACILDYMHLCLEGTVKKFLDLWFNSNNHYTPFYLSSFISSLDKLLSKIKFTSSFSRSQRSLSFHKLFKANEYRNLAFYSLIYILKGFLSQPYYEHLLQYILFLRILTKDKIGDTEIAFSKYLIAKFINEFEILYGTVNLKYNLHGHLHLPDQVSDMGPLHKTSAFAGEGAFQIYEKNFNGTVNIANQIVNRLNLKSLNNQFLNKAEIDKIANLELRIFATKLFNKQSFKSNSFQITNEIQRPSRDNIFITTLSQQEQELFLLKQIDLTKQVSLVNKMHYKNICKYIINSIIILNQFNKI